MTGSVAIETAAGIAGRRRAAGGGGGVSPVPPPVRSVRYGITVLLNFVVYALVTAGIVL